MLAHFSGRSHPRAQRSSTGNARESIWRVIAAVGVVLLAQLPSTAQAQLSVSASGAPHFSQAIAVPPGVAGMAPQLSIEYSGDGGNGPLGLGWSVQGLSLITRCPATMATDGSAAGVGFVPDDKLCLDGKRLIQLNSSLQPVVGVGTNDASGVAGPYREYRTEIDSYARVRAYGYANGDSTGASGPAYFRVWTKGGQIIDYGAAPSSDSNTKALINVQGRSTAMVWAVARISDVTGNHVDFKYEQRDVNWGSGTQPLSPTPGHEWNLQEIQYSGAKVIFTYDPSDGRPDKTEAYQQGAKTVGIRRLQSITTYINSPNVATVGPASSAISVATYRFEYDNASSSSRSRLGTLRQCAGGASSTRCLTLGKFTYSAGGGDVFAATTAFNEGGLVMQAQNGNVGVILGDFNGDGKTDFIRWSDTPSQNQLFLSVGDGSFKPVPSGSGSGQFNIIDQNLFRSDGCYQAFTGDFNGDGLVDILRYTALTSPSGGSCPTSASDILYLNKGDGSFAARTVAGADLYRKISQQTTNCVSYLSNGVCAEPGNQVGWTTGQTFYLLDVDGDSKLDVVTAWLPGQDPMPTPSDPCVNSVCTRVYKGDGQGNFTEIASSLAHHALYSIPDPGYAVGSPSHIADLDGDMLTDIVNVGIPWLNSTNSAWRSVGHGDFVPVTSPGYCTYPIDFNGDGKRDCLLPSLAPNSALQVSTGGGPLNIVTGFNLHSVGQELGGSGIGVVIADVNGDGWQDILRWEDDPTKNALFLSNGDGTFTQSTTFRLGANGSNYPLQSSTGTAAAVIGDFTGHGNTEILRLQTVNGVASNALFTKTASTPADLLQTVTSATGLMSTLVQVPLSNPVAELSAGSADLGPRYLSDRGQLHAAQVPTVDVDMPSYVVATVQSDTGVGSTKTNVEYVYRGLKVDTLGRGSLGFREVLSQSVGADGSSLTTDTQYLQTHPYIGMAAESALYNAPLNAISNANVLSKTTKIYCDQTVAAGPDGITSLDPSSGPVASALSTGTPCDVTAKIQRPYLLQSVSSGQDLVGALLPTSIVQVSVNGAGTPAHVDVTTTGTVAGVSQTFKQASNFDPQPDDISCTSDNLSCHWFIGRVAQRRVTHSVPNSLPSITTSAGNSPNATATSGNGALQTGVVNNLNFGAVTVGLSAVQTSTIANDGATALALTPPTAASVTAGDFSFVSTDCPSSLAPQATCRVTVKFAPIAGGSRAGTLMVNSGGGALTATLSGSGAAPTVAILPGWTNWGQVGAASDSGDWLTVKNNSTVSVLLTAHTPASNPTGTMRSDSATAAGYCNFGATVLAPGGSCQTFFGMGAGAAVGAYSATDRISYQTQGFSGSTFSSQQAYSFSIADTTPSPASLSFGNVNYLTSSTKSVLLSNPADAPLDNLAVSIGGTNASSFSTTNTCGTSVPAHGSCVVSITFTPQVIANNLAGQLSITGAYSRYTGAGAASYYPHARSIAVNLTGNGYGTVATLTSASSLTVPAAWYGAGAQAVKATYRNDGTAPMTLSAPALAAPLSATTDCTSIAGGATCSVNVTVETNVGGINQSQMVVPSGATQGPAATAVQWTTYTAVPRWSSTSLDFGSVPINRTATRTITLYNDGNATYDWATNKAVASLPAGFSVDTSACASVPAAGSCPATVTFAPTSATSYSAAGLTMNSASYSANTFAVQGTGLSLPSVSVSTTSISSKVMSPTPASGTVSFTNNGQTPTTLTLSVTGGAHLSTSTLSCPANGSCGSVTVTSPTSMGTYGGTLSMSSSAGGTVTSVALDLQVTGSIATMQTSTALVFPNLNQGGTSPLVYWTIKNTGNAVMNLSFSALNPPFNVKSSNCTNVMPSTSCGMEVLMDTSAVGTFSQKGIGFTGATLGNRSDLSLSGSVNTATTTVSASPTSLYFGTVSTGMSKKLTVSVVNTGSVSANFMAPAVSPSGGSSDMGDFFASGCSSAVSAGASCTITVTWSGGCTAGTRTATMNIRGSNFQPVSVGLSATNAKGICQ